jgi:hypothetical protein
MLSKAVGSHAGGVYEPHGSRPCCIVLSPVHSDSQLGDIIFAMNVPAHHHVVGWKCSLNDGVLSMLEWISPKMCGMQTHKALVSSLLATHAAT